MEAAMNLKNKKGFTLVAVLIAIVVLAVGVLAMARMQGSAAAGNAFSNQGVVALQLAEEMMDRIRVNAGNPGDNPSAYNGCAGAVDPALGDCAQWQTRFQNSGLSGAAGTVVVTNNSPIGSTATITVTVSWNWGVVPRSVILSTIVGTWGV